MDKNILVYIQENEEGIEPVSYELLEKAKELLKEMFQRVYAVYFGMDVKRIAGLLSGYPLEKLFYYEMQKPCIDVNIMAVVIADLCRSIKPDLFLIGATRHGRSLAPCIAARLGTGLTADCTELYLDDEGELLQIRPAFEEKMLACIRTRTRPQMATVRPGIIKLPEKDWVGKTEPDIEPIETVGKEVLEAYEILSQKPVKESEAVNITDEKLLIVVGAGVTDREEVEVLKQWSESLGGTLACSRKLVERGWFTSERQVGLSGNASKAEVMITVGVSGSVQFQAGIHNVKHLIAVNIDQDAPIMALADEGIRLDIYLFVQMLKARLATKGIDRL